MSPASHPIAFAKRIVREILGDQTVGMIDYLRCPGRKEVWGGPFNGQPMRQALFREIVSTVRPCAIVETGTYLGTTTEFMAQMGLPVYTIELGARKFGFVRARFWRSHNITVLCRDSRTGLHELFGGPLRQLAGDTLFVYLDAHWNDDLPLAEEIHIIFTRCPSAVVMIDDFQVPGDTGYGYDDYGAGKCLAFSYVAPATSAHGVQGFYPSTPSTKEGGQRRGCIVLAKKTAHVRALALMSLLRRASDEPRSERGPTVHIGIGR